MQMLKEPQEGGRFKRQRAGGGKLISTLNYGTFAFSFWLLETGYTRITMLHDIFKGISVYIAEDSPEKLAVIARAVADAVCANECTCGRYTSEGSPDGRSPRAGLIQ